MEASFKKASDAVATLFNRRPGGEETHTLEAPEPALPRNWPEKLPFRKRPKPYSRSIGWTPRGEGPAQPGARDFELFVAQSVLAEVRQHLITATSGEPFGFLIGQVVYCPWADSPYIVVDTVRRETQNLPPANEPDRFRHAWVAATRDARHRRGEVIGWYHRHGVLGLRLSEWDLQLQEEFFPQPWHCALVIASSSRGIIGGFIQRSRRAKLFRKGLAPFHEIVDLDAKLVNGFKPSVVDWENYAAGEAVSVIKANWPSPSTRHEKWKTKQHGDEVELPTQGGSVVPPKGQPRRKGSLGGRMWNADQGEAETPRSPSDTASVTEDDFTSAVGPLGQPVVYRSEEVPEAEVRVPTRTNKVSEEDEETAKATTAEKPAAKKPAATRTTTRKTASTKKAAAKEPESGDFLDAVWGPPPFEAEEGEPQTEEDGAVAVPDDDSPAARRPSFEMVPSFEAEPPEIDRPGSMEWLLGLIGETLSNRQKAAKADDAAVEADDAAVEADDQPPVSADPTPSPAADAKRARAPLAVPTPSKSRPSEGQKRLGMAAIVLLGLVLVARLVIGVLGSETPTPIAVNPAAGPVAAPPSDEFVGLVDGFLTGVQAFREGLVEFRLDRSDCPLLTTAIVRVAGAHALLAAYVDAHPEIADRFATLDGEFAATSLRFASTDCPIPPELTPAGAPTGDDSGL